MENWTESLEKYLEEGKLPLIGEKFSRKKEIGDKLKLQREESHKIALSRRRKQGVGRGIPFSWGIAAMFLLLLGIGGYYFSEKKIVTEGTALAYELPDGSNVQIMENSSLTYNRITWLWERKLQLFGKASFEVTKGKTFTVNTEAGAVTVLGTKFLVDQQGKKMFVNCEEGSVKVETAVGKRTLVVCAVMKTRLFLCRNRMIRNFRKSWGMKTTHS
jgi:transmembrane sensor